MRLHGALLRPLGRLALTLLVGVVLCAPPSFGGGRDTEKVDEYHLKAAFLYNFALFTDWPKESFDDPKAPLVVAVVGKDPFGKHLTKTFDGKKAKGRPTEIRRFKSVDNIGHCHILYVPKDQASKIDTIRKKIGKQSVLIIGEKPGFALQGGAVNFYAKGSKIAFEINPKAAERARVTISSQLLKLARVVKEKDDKSAAGGDR
ncbi:MAG: YfiR family protein [Planctomycetota bacterium]